MTGESTMNGILMLDMDKAGNITERSAKNPTGLFIAEYSATQIHGEQKTPHFDDGATEQ